MILKKDNVVLQEEDKGRIEELKLNGYEEVKPKKQNTTKASSK